MSANFEADPYPNVERTAGHLVCASWYCQLEWMHAGVHRAADGRAWRTGEERPEPLPPRDCGYGACTLSAGHSGEHVSFDGCVVMIG